MHALGRDVVEDIPVDEENRDFMNLYLTLYDTLFGKYEEIEHTLFITGGKISTRGANDLRYDNTFRTVDNKGTCFRH